MNAPLDALAVHAQNIAATRVAVDRRRESAAPRPSTTTFAELNALVNRLAHGLLAAGAQPGERLVWCGPNSLEVLATIHAARKLQPRRGAALVPLQRRGDGVRHRQLRRDDRRRRRRRGTARRARCATELPKVRAVVVFGGAVPPAAAASRWDDVLAGPARRPSPTSRPTSEAGAAMIYTSGTTGKPKGALRTRTDRQIVFALLAELQPAARERGAPHDRPAVPLGPARVRVAVAHARRADRRAAQVRPGALDRRS